MTFKNTNEFDKIATVTFTEIADQETSSDLYATRFSGSIGAWFLEVQNQCYQKLLTDVESSHPFRVLEVGGGHGQLIKATIESGGSLTVVGSSEGCAKRIQAEINKDQISFVVADFLNVPFADKSFDVATAIRLVTHAHDWPGVIGELCRVAKDAVIIDYPSRRSTNIFYSVLYPLKKSSEKTTRPFKVFTDGEIRAQFLRHGFVQKKSFPQFFFPMVIHRQLKNVAVAKFLEGICRVLGLTSLFGSPTLISFIRLPETLEQKKTA